jgi:hypothetical protein
MNSASRLSPSRFLLTAATVGGFASPAIGQGAEGNPFDRGRHEAVTERAQPEFDPETIRVSTFDLDASVGISTTLDDNPLAKSIDKSGDVIIGLRPEVSIVSNWSAHQVAAGVTIDHKEFLENESETTTDYSAFLRGRLDARRDFELQSEFSTGQVTEPRYEPGSNDGAVPAQTKYEAAVLGGLYMADRLQIKAQLGLQHRDYQAVYDFRDVEERFVALQASYAFSPDVALFGRLRKGELRYDQLGGARDGDQTTFQLGMNFELAAPFRGEVSIGQARFDPLGSTSADTEGLSVDAEVMWFPTRLTTVTLTSRAGISDPGIVEATSATFTNFGLRVDHEFARNTLLFGRGGLGEYDFARSPGSPFSRRDEYAQIELGVEYKINRHASLQFSARTHTQDTTGTAPRSFDQNTVMAGLVLYP